MVYLEEAGRQEADSFLVKGKIMKTTFGSFCGTLAAITLAAQPVAADHHEGMQFAANELMLCAYKDGKDRDDLMDLTKAFNKWLKKNDANYTYYLLSPHYHEDASEMDFAWVGTWPDGAGMGAGYDAWMSDDDDVGQMFDDVMDCSMAMSPVTPVHTPDDGPWERGVVWFQRCEREDGASLSDAVMAHKKASMAMAEMGETSASWVFLPGLGFGDPDFDYYHVQAWPNYTELGKGFDNYFNKGGWKAVSEAEGGVMECHSPNLYTFRMMHSAAND